MDLDTYKKNGNELPIIKQENCIKFGEIVLSDNGKFTFICTFCEGIFSKSILLISHINEKHVNVETESIKEAFLANDNDLENIQSFLITKLYVKYDVKSSNSENFNCPELNNEDYSTSNNQETNHSLNYKIGEKSSSPLNLLEQNIKENAIKKKLKKIIPFNTCKTEEQKNKKKRTRLLNGNVNWQCPLCNVILKCTSKYDHLKRHTGKTTFKCKHCDEEFSTKVRRRNHEKIHTGESDRPVKCSDCPKKFKSKVILTNHIRRDHLGIREHKCDYCEKKFYLKVEKISHERSNHTKEKPCICEICGLSFRVQQKLNTHMQNHDEPKFQCDKCDKKFYAKANLKRHQICHSNLKPFSCEICSANFPRLSAYKTHLKLHTDIKEYICRFCSKDYYDISGISCHMKTAHKMQYNKINVLRRSQMQEND